MSRQKVIVLNKGLQVSLQLSAVGGDHKAKKTFTGTKTEKKRTVLIILGQKEGGNGPRSLTHRGISTADFGRVLYHRHGEPLTIEALALLHKGLLVALKRELHLAETEKIANQPVARPARRPVAQKALVPTNPQAPTRTSARLGGRRVDSALLQLAAELEELDEDDSEALVPAPKPAARGPALEPAPHRGRRIYWGTGVRKGLYSLLFLY
jgi:hypothetical protein